MDNYKKKTIESYDESAKIFSEKFKSLMDLDRRPEFLKFIDLIPGKRILDLGSAAGDHAHYFSQKGLDVTCVDLSKNMVDLCKSKNLKAFVMDIEDLHFEPNSFDGIWPVASLLHVPKSKISNVLSKLHSILTSDGVLYVCLKEGEGERFIDDSDSLKRYFVFWRKDELLKIFGNKFHIIDFRRTLFGKNTFLQFFFRKR